MKKVFHALVFSIAVWLSFGNNVIHAAIVPAKSFFGEGYYINGVSKWVLPNMLTGVSGIKYLGDNRFACIQDEVGTIFIYNADADQIEKIIPFSGAGDFKGIAIAGTSAYVAQSNGTIYEVQGYEGAQPLVKKYDMPLTAKHNVEGLTYDKKHNRLLLAIKGESRNQHYKGVYAFDLKSKQLAATPVVKINLADPIFATLKEKGTNNGFQFSAIELHPVTNDLYILLGADPKLLVLDAKGRVKKLYSFRSSDFPQAEGMAFTPEGDLFISNGGVNGAATILKVVL